MTFKATSLVTLVLAAQVLGCGNYSNEDLEFMNAVPEGGQLAVNIPARTSAVTLVEEAELARTTHNVTATLNGIVDGMAKIVDGVRSASPTSRASDRRTWGPFPADQSQHPGWWVRMIVERVASAADPQQLQFHYQLAFHHEGAADTDWPLFLDGTFQAGGTARRGLGAFDITTATLRAEGFDPMFGMVDHLHAAYDTESDPLFVEMQVTNLPDATMASAPTAVTYSYQGAADGRGQMTFGLSGNLVVGPALEQVTVTSQWLASGEGRASLTITSGDGAGLMQTECWDRLFIPTYNAKPWAAAENVGLDPSVCPSIPAL
jgi:hypothetical protein